MKYRQVLKIIEKDGWELLVKREVTELSNTLEKPVLLHWPITVSMMRFQKEHK